MYMVVEEIVLNKHFSQTTVLLISKNSYKTNIFVLVLLKINPVSFPKP